MASVLWTQKQDIGPKARTGHAMVYDLQQRRITLFGGDSLDGFLRRDTWAWNGESWTQVQDIGPTGRTSHAMAYDSARHRTILFGGRTQTGTVGDTWEWDGEHWTQVADLGPSARSAHAMVFDSVRVRTLLFGGEAPNGELLNDTWAWDGNEWVQQEDTGPSPRSGVALAFDSKRARAVLCGGAEVKGVGLGDTWEWDGVTWTRATDFGPDACSGAAMAFNGISVQLYGGIGDLSFGASATLFQLTWEWDGKLWTARQDMGPGPRMGHTLAFDTARSRLVLFGGLAVPPGSENAAQRVMGDTWEAPTGPVFVDLAGLDITPNPVFPG
jgi:hypothetical protein